jgi:hypothetical protein
MISVFNSTAGDTWSFDGISSDGRSGIVIYLSRGTVGGIIAAQRGLISVVWPNGTRYLENAFVQQSTLRMCKEITEVYGPIVPAMSAGALPQTRPSDTPRSASARPRFKGRSGSDLAARHCTPADWYTRTRRLRCYLRRKCTG